MHLSGLELPNGKKINYHTAKAAERGFITVFHNIYILIVIIITIMLLTTIILTKMKVLYNRFRNPDPDEHDVFLRTLHMWIYDYMTKNKNVWCGSYYDQADLVVSVLQMRLDLENN